MDKTYQPEQIEQKWYQVWEEANYFKPTFEGEPYCIMLPPPNVTGTLHMGHGFQISIMDALIRYYRMQGYNTHWQVGTDHAGIATQIVVELQLAKEGLSRQALGREGFLTRVWEWKGQSDGTIKKQLRRMGASVDWEKERFSLDEGLNEAVKTVFISLYEEGLIYRGTRLVNWDPVLLTAISDLEVVSKEEEGTLWYISYPLVEGQGELVVATTRPETLLGDVAVAVNPLDERYQHLIGKHLQLPLTNREIPIIADSDVAIDFGTGCVKITPAHDFNDYAIGNRHQLPLINIFTPDAKLNDQVPATYQGLDRFVAREKILHDLTALGLIVKIMPHVINTPRAERSGAVIEPYITQQWFVKTAPLAQPALDAVKQGEIRFVPESWTKIYYQWLENIQDWCISRQLWWGHRIPAWYDDKGQIYVGNDESEIRNKYNLPPTLSLKQDEDVLDTWFSAALWPFATLGWPQKTRDLSAFYPTNVLVTGFDIIFFWVARMIMMGLKFNQQIPFRTVYVTGLVRDAEGQKMSKSKGNILDPIDLIDGIELEALIQKRTAHLIHAKNAEHIKQMTIKEFKDGILPFGTDSLRFTYYALASTGRDIKFDLSRIEGYRNFCNKIWNAARYVLMNTETTSLIDPDRISYSIADKWIKHRLQLTIQKVHQCFQEYRFDLLAQTVYEFIWNEYCGWYLEFSKPILYLSDEVSLQAGARKTLLQVLEILLRLIHPLMPFITEEIWQRVAQRLLLQGTIMLQPYPKFDPALLNEAADEDMEWLKRVIIAIRNIRGEMNVSPSKSISIFFHKGTPLAKDRTERMQLYIKALAKVDHLSWITHPPEAAATALIDELEVFVPLADLIDKQSELDRLTKEINKITIDLQKSEQKLNNSNYVQKAPSHVVAQEKQRAIEMKAALIKLRERYQVINKLE